MVYASTLLAIVAIFVSFLGLALAIILPLTVSRNQINDTTIADDTTYSSNKIQELIKTNDDQLRTELKKYVDEKLASLVKNQETTSTTNTYSCDYINAKFNQVVNDLAKIIWDNNKSKIVEEIWNNNKEEIIKGVSEYIEKDSDFLNDFGNSLAGNQILQAAVVNGLQAPGSKFLQNLVKEFGDSDTFVLAVANQVVQSDKFKEDVIQNQTAINNIIKQFFGSNNTNSVDLINATNMNVDNIKTTNISQKDNTKGVTILNGVNITSTNIKTNNIDRISEANNIVINNVGSITATNIKTNNIDRINQANNIVINNVENITTINISSENINATNIKTNNIDRIGDTGSITISNVGSLNVNDIIVNNSLKPNNYTNSGATIEATKLVAVEPLRYDNDNGQHIYIVKSKNPKLIESSGKRYDLGTVAPIIMFVNNTNITNPTFDDIKSIKGSCSLSVASNFYNNIVLGSTTSLNNQTTDIVSKFGWEFIKQNNNNETYFITSNDFGTQKVINIIKDTSNIINPSNNAIYQQLPYNLFSNT